MKILAYILVILALGNFVSPKNACAQSWVQIAKFDSEVVCVHFLDKQGQPGIGVAGTQDGKVYHTVDFGRSWQASNVVLPIKGPVTSFVFKDATNGWLTCRQLNKPGCYETHDGGNTWTQLGVNTWGNRFDIAYNPANNRLFMSSPDDYFRYSPDNGATWTKAGPIYLNGIVFSTGLVGVISCFNGGMFYTHDGGLTWLPSPTAVECWNPMAAGPSIFFMVSEASWQVFCSTDGGNVWKTRGSLPRRPTGDIRGVCGQLYAQSDSGLYYSNDEGYTWHSLGGPGNQSDTRFYSVGTTVYAGGADGGVYKLVDIDRPPEGRIAVKGPLPSILTIGCSGLDTTIMITGVTTCQTTKLLGYDFDSIRSTKGLRVFQPAGPFQFYDTAWFHDRKYHDLEHAALPYTFTFDDTSFVPLHVIYRPSAAKDSAVVTLHYQIGVTLFDTTITLYASRDRRISVLFDHSPLIMNAKSACKPEVGIFTALNGKCDSVTILAVHPLDSVHFHVMTKLPTTLLPFGSLPIAISASGETRDTFLTMIDVVTEVAGVVTHLQMPAALYVPRDGPVTPGLPRLAVVAPTNICAKRKYTIPIHNLGCFRMICESPHWIIPIPELRILSQPSYPDTINPGESDSIIMEYAPDLPLSKTAILGINMHSASSNIDTSIQIHTSAYDLSKATLSADAMEFDSLLICNESERSVFIRNESCKPTRVTEIVASSYLDFISASPSVGDALGPGDSVEVRVRFKPRTPGDKLDSLTLFFLDSSNTPQALTVALHGYVIPDVPHVTMSIASVSMTDLDPCSDHDTSVTITNVSLCDTITIARADLSGTSWFTADVSSLPTRLAPGHSAQVHIHIQTNSDSASDASLHLTGAGIDTTLPLRAITAPIKGDEVLASYTDTVFHAKLCSSDVKKFVLRNRTCGPLEVNDLHLTDSTAFGIISPRAVPFVIPANSSVAFDVLFNADDTTSRTAAIHYTTSDGRIVRDIPISSMTTTRPLLARLTLRALDGSTVVSRLPGDTLSIALMSLDDIPDSSGPVKIAARLGYDHDLLDLQGIRSNANWTTAPQPTDDVRLVSSTSHALDTRTPLAVVSFTTHFAEPHSTNVQLTSSSFNDGDTTFASCVLSSMVIGGVACSIAPFCGDSLYGDALLNLPVSLNRVEAVETAGLTALHLRITAQTSTPLHFSVTDMRGVVVSDLGAYAPHVGDQEITYPFRASSGVYVLVLESEGRRLGRRFSITK